MRVPWTFVCLCCVCGACSPSSVGAPSARPNDAGDGADRGGALVGGVRVWRPSQVVCLDRNRPTGESGGDNGGGGRGPAPIVASCLKADNCSAGLACCLTFVPGRGPATSQCRSACL